MAASPGVAATWGAQEWASYVLDHISQESVLLRSGATSIPIDGHAAHIPRLLNDGTPTWTAEGAEINSDAPDADTLDLAPRKIANVVNLSNESIGDASVSVLNQVGDALTRSIATAIDAAAFSTNPATPTTPAGILSLALPGADGTMDLAGLLDGIGAVEAAGGVATAVYLNPADLTALRKEVLTGGFLLGSDPSQPGLQTLAGAGLYGVPTIVAGTALVAQADQIVVGVRQDASVDFSTDAAFTKDTTVARVVARVDWGINDATGLYHLT